MIKNAGADDSSILLIIQQTVEVIFSDYKNLGLSDEDLLRYLDCLRQARITQLSEWIDGKFRMLRLKSEPLQLAFKSVDNQLVDIQQMKGKVILIDFWATWCSACLEYMTTVKSAYEKYHKKGLEVLSISINKNSEKAKVLAIEKKMNFSWPLGIIGDEKLNNEIWKKFAFTSVPQLILLDKDGKLIENNGRLMSPETLDYLIKNALE